MVYSIVALIFIVPSNFLFDKMGARFGVTLGGIFLVIGMWIKVLINDQFWLVIFGQSIAALGNPFLATVSTKVSSVWFGKDERSMANTLA